MSGGTHIVPLDETHDLASFSSGTPSLDAWLVKRAHDAEVGRTARTFVLLDDTRLAGYYALAAGGIERQLLPGPLRRNSPDPIPSIILARLAVNRTHQGRGHGRRLLSDAAIRSLAASSVIGARLFLVHTTEGEAAHFYERFGFICCPGEKNTLFLPLSEVARAFSIAQD